MTFKYSLSIAALCIGAFTFSNAQAALEKSNNTGVSACPCQSSNFCQGPRGGKYCVTKRGHKKYIKRVKR
jgi:hypothetical protein